METNSAPVRVGSLDSLRGVAILMVILVHSLTHVDGHGPIKVAADFLGNFGVHLFFIVSAYTMCMMWRGREAEHRRTEKFYIRRVCRIAVPYIGAIVLYQGLAAGHHAPVNVWGAAVNAAFLHGVFPRYNNSIVPGGWSIADEMNFYLVFPLIVKFSPLYCCLIALAWYVVIGIGFEHHLARLNVDGYFIYCALSTQLPVFLIGMVSYYLGRGQARGFNQTVTIALLMVLWIIIAFVAKKHGLDGRPYFWLGVLAMAILAWIAVRVGASLTILSFVGRRSYSMYLLHFCAIQWLHALPAQTPWIVWFAAIVLLSLIMASIGLRTVEAWGQGLGKWLIARLPVDPEPAAPRPTGHRAYSMGRE